MLHRITATTDRLGKHVAYTYDSVGNQTSVTYPDGTTATKEYDLVHNLTKVVEEDGRTTTYEYDGMGRVTHMEYPDGWVEDYHYDSIGQLLAIEDTDPSQKDMKQQKNVFEYDVCGNMTREYMRGNGTGEATTDVTYTYDELHRVTSAKELYGNAWRSYQYDSLGNLTYEENSNSVHYDYKLNNLNQLVQKTYSSNDKEGTVYTYDNRGNLVKEEYGKFNGNANGNKRQTVAEYTYDETNKMVKGVNSIGESSSYLFNGKNALVEQTWHIAKNGYGYHDVNANTEDADTTAKENGKGGNGSGGKGHGNGNGQGNGNGAGDKPTGSTVGSFSTVVKQFVIDYTRETMDPLMEHEVNGLDYRYVYGNERLSVNISPIENGSGHIVESGTVGQQIRLYYHQDLRGTVDYLTSPVSQKVESWTHYNEWGEITLNAVLKTGQRELDLVKNYTGHDFDAVLNLYYAKARMYDAENRRFTSIDPILDGSRYDLSQYTTAPVMFVQYLYVRNMPLIAVDPLGKYLIAKFDTENGTRYRLVAESAIGNFGKTFVHALPVVGNLIVGTTQGFEGYVAGTGYAGKMEDDISKETIDGAMYALDVVQRSAIELKNFTKNQDALDSLLIITGLKKSDVPMTIKEGLEEILKEKIGVAKFNAIKKGAGFLSIVSTVMSGLNELETDAHRIYSDTMAFEYILKYQEVYNTNLLESDNVEDLVALMTAVENYMRVDYDYHFEYMFYLQCRGATKRRDDEWLWIGPTQYEAGQKQEELTDSEYENFVNYYLTVYDNAVSKPIAEKNGHRITRTPVVLR